CVERQVNKPRLVPMFLNALNRLAPKGVGRVINRTHRVRATQDRIMRVARGIEVIVRSAQKTEILIETAFERMELREIAQMRFAEPAIGVTKALEAIPCRRFLE